MAATIYDIAERAGVSMATVSRVINRMPHVSEKSRERVEQAIRELHYVPNAYARSLSNSKSNIIGVIVPEITNPFFGEIIHGITEIGDQNGLNVMFFNSDETAVKEMHALQILQQYKVCGLIMTPVEGINSYDPAYVKQLKRLNIPIVLMDRDVINSGFDGVYFDDRTALFDLTSVLLDRGHRRIAALIGNPEHVISQNRV